MKRFRDIFHVLDKVLTRLFNTDIEQEKKYIDIRKARVDRDHVLYDMSVIDSKSSALLTHVSIMLGVVLVLIGFGKEFTNRTWQVIMTCEFVAFSVVAMLLLRCIDIVGPPKKMPLEDCEEINDVYKEINLRRGIYQSMVRTIFLLTAILVTLFIIKAIALTAS